MVDIASEMRYINICNLIHIILHIPGSFLLLSPKYPILPPVPIMPRTAIKIIVVVEDCSALFCSTTEAGLYWSTFSRLTTCPVIQDFLSTLGMHEFPVFDPQS